jgi:2-amino-4-hydroxy-6-hydroxymethyldihydropteridine diphosphokinase
LKKQVYIGIGGNIGDRETYINTAIDLLSIHLFEVSCSRFYRTAPRDYLDQDYFLNVVVSARTEMSCPELLELTQSIEKGGGRKRDKKIPKGPRTIDLDILLYGDEIVSTDSLTVPHPAITERLFVLIPLLELNPDLKDPLSQKYYSEFLDKVEKQGVYCSSLNDYNNLFL